MHKILRQIALLLTLTMSWQVGSAQTSSNTPTLITKIDNAELQFTLYPGFYSSHDVAEDMQWVQKNSVPIEAFLALHGQAALEKLSTLSGCTWPESRLELLLLRYYPTPGSADPLIIPIGAIRTGDAAIAAPTGEELAIDILFQLAKRLLLTGTPNDVREHPVMSKDPYYLDNLAMLLARSVALQLYDEAAVQTALDSPFWKRFWTGKAIYNRYLAGKWILTPDRPLLTFLRAEPTDSDLSRSAKIEACENILVERTVSPDLAPNSRLGMALSNDGSKRLLIAAVDETKIAYVCGVRSGDRIISINGAQPKTVREAIELTLIRLDNGGTTIEIARGGTTRSFVLRPRIGSSTPKNTQDN